MENDLKRTALWMSCVLLLISAAAAAQQPETPTPTELSYWLEQQAKQHADGVRLQEQLSELQKKLDTDPHKALRDAIQAHERFASEARRLRAEAETFTRPPLARTFDWVVHDVVENAEMLKRNLAARERTTAADQLALRRQIDDKQKEIALNSKLEKKLNDTIQSVREARRQDGIAAELGALENLPGRNVISPQAPPPVIVHNPDKNRL